MEELTNHIDETGKRNDHDLLMNVAVRQREMCLDIKEIKSKLEAINQRCQIQPRQCGQDFVNKQIYDLQHNQLKTSMDEGFKKFKEEQTEERRRNRWVIGIIVSVVNIGASVFFHIFMK